MATIAPVDGPPSPRPCARRRWWLLLGLLTASLTATAAIYGYYLLSADRALRQTIAETDELDPRWRLQDLEADRAVVPEHDNSAPLVLAAHALLPASWANAPIFDALYTLQPNVQVGPAQMAALRTALQPLEPAVGAAAKLAGLPRGRFAITYAPDYCATWLSHVQSAREVGALLCYDATLRSQDRDAEGAWTSTRGALNAGRAIGDEPSAISQLVRSALRRLALRSMERTLAQDEVAVASLADTQQILEDEAGQDLLLRAVRGERAGMHRLMAFLEATDGSLKPYLTGFNPLCLRHRPSLSQHAADKLPGNRKAAHAWLLRYATQAVEAAKLPPDKQGTALRHLCETRAEAPGLVGGLAADWDKVGTTLRESRALLVCGVGAVAVERYRLKNSRWPDDLQTLVHAGLLKAVPDDPFGPSRLSFRRTADGVVVYSVGEQGSYAGDALDKKNFNPEANRLEFRLWAVGKRRQEAGVAQAAGGP